MNELEPTLFAQTEQLAAEVGPVDMAQTEQDQTMGALEAMRVYGTLATGVGVIAAVATVGAFWRRGNSGGDSSQSEPNFNVTWGCLQNLKEAATSPSLPRGMGSMSCGGQGVEGCTYKLKKSGGGVSSEGSCKLR